MKLPHSPQRDTAPVRTDNLEEALAKLAFIVERGRPLGVLVGAAGMGKSTCLALLADEVREPHRAVVEISAAGMSAATLVSAITAGLGLGRGAAATADRLNLLMEYLQGISMTEESAAILIDDLELATDESVLMLQSLLRRLKQSQSNASIIAATRFAESGALRELLNQAGFVVKLTPWTAAESSRYALGVVERLTRQSRGSYSMIDDSVLRTLHECSQGIPGPLARILELSLLACEEMEQPRLTGAIIRAASEELYPQEPEPFTLSRRIAQPAGV